MSRALQGAGAGIVSGVLFAMAAMMYAAISGPGFWAPPRMISTIVGFDMGATFAIGAVVVGLMLHMMLSAMYGAAFAVVIGRRQPMTMMMLGAGFGLALYVVNFEVIAQLEQFAAFRMMAGNWFEIVDHVMFGVILGALVARTGNSRHA